MENSFKKTEVSKRRKWNNVHKQTVFTPLNIFACWNLKTWPMHVYHIERQTQQPASGSCTTFVPSSYFLFLNCWSKTKPPGSKVQRLPVPGGLCCCKDACQQTAASQCTLPSPGFSAVSWWPSPLEAQEFLSSPELCMFHFASSDTCKKAQQQFLFWELALECQGSNMF